MKSTGRVFCHGVKNKVVSFALTCHLRWVDQCVSGDTDELAEQVDGELLRGGRGEALQEELQEAGEAVPLQLGLDLLQTFPAVGPIQRQLAQQLVQQPQGQQILKLVVGLEQRGRDPEHGGHQVGRVHGRAGVPSVSASTAKG